MSRRVLSPPILAVAILAGGGIPAFAGPPTVPDWVEAYAQEAMAALVTLENAQKYGWYQLPQSVRFDHPLVYDIDIAPVLKRLQQYGDGVFGPLKQRLDERVAAIRTLEEAGPFQGQCSWIMARERGDGVTRVQVDLDTYCRTKAVPLAYQRLVRERAEGLDLRLAELRTVDVTYPSRLIGTDGFIQNTDIRLAYAKALETRLVTAQPVVVGEIADMFRAKTPDDGPLRTGSDQCQGLLGPWYPQSDPVRDLAMSDPLRGSSSGEDAARQFGRVVSTACLREANGWLMRQQPAIDSAIKATFASADPARGPVRSVTTRCSAVLGRWFRAFDGFEQTLIGPLRQTCEEEAGRFIDRALDLRARAIATRIAAAPRTLDGLERNGWFEPAAADLDAALDPNDPGRDAIAGLMRARTLALTVPMRHEAQLAAVAEISKAYTDGGLTDTGLYPAQNLCAPYLGTATRTVPAGGGDMRHAIQDACRSKEGVVAARRAEAAVTTADIDAVLGKGMIALTAPEGATTRVDPRAFVIAAAANGFQVRFRERGIWFFRSTSIRISPLGREGPTLEGTLRRESRADGVVLWRVVELDSLPGLDGPLNTVACLTQGRDAGQGFVALAAGGIAAAVFDAPRTAGTLLGAAFGGLVSASACEKSRSAFLGQSPS